ncbi:hypothetical protein D9M71_718430 [compost metagenome]
MFECLLAHLALLGWHQAHQQLAAGDIGGAGGIFAAGGAENEHHLWLLAQFRGHLLQGPVGLRQGRAGWQGDIDAAQAGIADRHETRRQQRYQGKGGQQENRRDHQALASMRQCPLKQAQIASEQTSGRLRCLLLMFSRFGLEQVGGHQRRHQPCHQQ